MSMTQTTENDRQQLFRQKNDGTRQLLMLIIHQMFMLWRSPVVLAAWPGNLDIEGAPGMLYVHGTLTESACRLGMNSLYQDIVLEDTGKGQLRYVGMQGTPVRFTLRLEDCLYSLAGSKDPRTGWRIRDDSTPALVKAPGFSVLGLTTAQGEHVRPGDQGRPLLLTSGQNVLNYVITPERTSAALGAGSYRAVIDFYLSYD